MRIRDEAQPLQPGEVGKMLTLQVEVLKDSFFNLPYKEPSPTLLQLMGIVVQAGQRFSLD